MQTHFKSIEEMNEAQLEAEVLEALRVSEMSPQEHWEWITNVWGKLQRDAAELCPRPPPDEEQAYFVDLNDKNKHDEERELLHALSLISESPKNAY